MSRRFFSGDSVEQAVLQAARYHQIEAAEIAYSVVEKRHGFLKIRRRVVIDVDPDAPRKEATEPAPGPAAPSPSSGAGSGRARESARTRTPQAEAEPERVSRVAETREGDESSATAGAGEKKIVELPDAPRRPAERFPRATGAAAEAAEEALRLTFELGMLRLQAAVLQGEDRLEIELWGEDQELLLEDRGRLLLAIQHLLPRLIRGITGEPAPCRVDCDNFHEIRAERLRDLAQRAAHEVRHRGRPKTLEPMSPDERRIVHLTLADDPAVVTESHGDGLFKRVVVRPVARRPRGFDPYSR